MKLLHLSHIIRHSAMVALCCAAGAFAGCVETPLHDGDGSGDAYISLRIGISNDDATQYTRAASDYPEAAAAHPHELMQLIRVIVVNSQGFVEVNETKDLSTEPASEYQTATYRVLGNDDKRVYLLANVENLTLRDSVGEILAQPASEFLNTLIPGIHAPEDYLNKYLYSSLIDYSDYCNPANGEALSAAAAANPALPITAVHNITVGSNITETMATAHPVELALHRASVKYTYRIINETKIAHRMNLRASINHVANVEYLMPHAVYDANDKVISYRTPELTPFVGDTLARYYDNIFVPASTNLAKPETVVLNTAGYSPIYVPEGASVSATTPYMTSVCINGMETGWQKLLWSAPGGSEIKTMTDLPRNTHVVVNIIIKTNNISVTVQMVPYNEVLLEPTFGLLPDRDLTPIYDENGNIIMWYDPADGTYYGPDRTTVISNMYLSVDPSTGWYVIRNDANDRVLYYYDAERGRYYFDLKGENEFDINTEWEVVRDAAGNRLYYRAIVGSEEFHITEKESDPETRWIIIRDSAGNIKYYFSMYIDNGYKTYYLPDKTTVHLKVKSRLV